MNYSNMHHPLMGGFLPYYPYLYSSSMAAASSFGSARQQPSLGFPYLPSYYGQVATPPELESGSFRIPMPIYKVLRVANSEPPAVSSKQFIECWRPQIYRPDKINMLLF